MTHSDDFLKPDGRLSARLAGWESRPQQLEMANLVTAAIAARAHAIVEAGTGVGKSLAYLVPAVLAATADQTEAPSPTDFDQDFDPDFASNPDSDNTAADHAEKIIATRPRRIVISTHTIALQEQLINKDINRKSVV